MHYSKCPLEMKHTSPNQDAAYTQLFPPKTKVNQKKSMNHDTAYNFSRSLLHSLNQDTAYNFF